MYSDDDGSRVSGPRLLGDVGGTHARFAWQAGPGEPLEHLRTLGCGAYERFEDALGAYLADLPAEPPVAAAVAIANPVQGDGVRMTNHHWSFSIQALRAAMGWRRFVVLNDFSALALALPAIEPSELRQVGEGKARPGPCAVLGPGTGLGVSGLLPVGDGRQLPISGEGGHVTLAATDAREARVLALLRRRFEHVSAERVLSGPGLVNLYEAVCEVYGWRPQRLTPADVSHCALRGSDQACVEAVALFGAFLGNVAGNLALTLGAIGGVYIGGGIVPRLGPVFEASPFRERFEGKGRFRDYLALIPTWVISSVQSPSLLGAARALDGR